MGGDSPNLDSVLRDVSDPWSVHFCASNHSMCDIGGPPSFSQIRSVCGVNRVDIPAEPAKSGRALNVWQEMIGMNLAMDSVWKGSFDMLYGNKPEKSAVEHLGASNIGQWKTGRVADDTLRGRSLSTDAINDVLKKFQDQASEFQPEVETPCEKPLSCPCVGSRVKFVAAATKNPLIKRAEVHCVGCGESVVGREYSLGLAAGFSTDQESARRDVIKAWNERMKYLIQRIEDHAKLTKGTCMQSIDIRSVLYHFGAFRLLEQELPNWSFRVQTFLRGSRVDPHLALCGRMRFRGKEYHSDLWFGETIRLHDSASDYIGHILSLEISSFIRACKKAERSVRTVEFVWPGVKSLAPELFDKWESNCRNLYVAIKSQFESLGILGDGFVVQWRKSEDYKRVEAIAKQTLAQPHFTACGDIVMISSCGDDEKYDREISIEIPPHRLSFGQCGPTVAITEFAKELATAIIIDRRDYMSRGIPGDPFKRCREFLKYLSKRDQLSGSGQPFVKTPAPVKPTAVPVFTPAEMSVMKRNIPAMETLQTILSLRMGSPNYWVGPWMFHRLRTTAIKYLGRDQVHQAKIATDGGMITAFQVGSSCIYCVDDAPRKTLEIIGTIAPDTAEKLQRCHSAVLKSMLSRSGNDNKPSSAPAEPRKPKLAAAKIAMETVAAATSKAAKAAGGFLASWAKKTGRGIRHLWEKYRAVKGDGKSLDDSGFWEGTTRFAFKKLEQDSAGGANVGASDESSAKKGDL